MSLNFPDSYSPKQSALDAFFNMSCTRPLIKDTLPRRGLILQNLRFAPQNYNNFLIYTNKKCLFVKKSIFKLKVERQKTATFKESISITTDNKWVTLHNIDFIIL